MLASREENALKINLITTLNYQYILIVNTSYCLKTFQYLIFGVKCSQCVSSLSDLSADNLFIQVVPEHLELRHGLLDGTAIGLLRHLLQQEACLVVQTLHLDLQLVRLSFELLTHQNIQ